MQIDLWFLVLALIFPRLALFGAWIWGGMPAHVGIPYWVCVLGSIFFARILVCVFVGMNLGVTSGWFIVHLIFAVLGTFGEFRSATSKSK
jgi:hypothetical protein